MGDHFDFPTLRALVAEDSPAGERVRALVRQSSAPGLGPLAGLSTAEWASLTEAAEAYLKPAGGGWEYSDRGDAAHPRDRDGLRLRREPTDP